MDCLGYLASAVLNMHPHPFSDHLLVYLEVGCAFADAIVKEYLLQSWCWSFEGWRFWLGEPSAPSFAALDLGFHVYSQHDHSRWGPTQRLPQIVVVQDLLLQFVEANKRFDSIVVVST